MSKFAYCWQKASEYSSPSDFESALALDTIWEDAPGAEAPAERIRWLGKLWVIRFGGVCALLLATGMTQAALSSRFGIPIDTVNSWCSGSPARRRNCPPYVLCMMAELLHTDGLF